MKRMQEMPSTEGILFPHAEPILIQNQNHIRLYKALCMQAENFCRKEQASMNQNIFHQDHSYTIQ